MVLSKSNIKCWLPEEWINEKYETYQPFGAKRMIYTRIMGKDTKVLNTEVRRLELGCVVVDVEIQRWSLSKKS